MFTKKLKKWLKDMGARNEARMGNQRLDCCNLNKQSNYRVTKPKSLNINQKQLMAKSN